MLAERDGSGAWMFTGSHALRRRVNAIARGLQAAGVARGDRVALMSPNRVDWIVANLAILHAGGVVVPLYATQAYDQVQVILNDSEARLLFVDSARTRDALRAHGLTLPHTIAMDPDGGADLAALEAAGEAAAALEPAALETVAASIAPADLAVLMYTSGTTGKPKGVMLTHANIASNAIDSFATIGNAIKPGDPVVSVLPYAHVYESTGVFGYFVRGLVVHVNTKIERLLDDLRDVQPVMVLTVPRIFERMLVAVVTKARAAGGFRARLIPWALAVGRDYMRAKHEGRPIDVRLGLSYRLAHALALGKIRSALGLGRLTFFASGSAPLHPDIAFTFLGFGVPISEGYGLTECSPVVTTNSPLNPQIGTVGSVIPNTEVRLADDGELLVRGPGVMRGYYRDREATDRVITDGWLHTGDIATIRADGCLRIVDRKNELFKTSGGKYIAPARVESALLRSLYFNQAMVFGSGRPHPVALIAPNWSTLRSELHLPADAPVSELAVRADIVQFLRHEAARQTADLASFEQIRVIGLLPRDLTIEDGELSPTLKIRRRVVEKIYGRLIEDEPVALVR